MVYPQKSDPKKTTRACLRNVKVSMKSSAEIGKLIKGKKVDTAKNYLQDVLEFKKAVPFKRYNDGVGHKKGYGPARYPINAVKEVIILLDSVRNNAEDRGFDTKKLFIKYFSANHSRRNLRAKRSRYSGQKGKNINISIVVEERG